MKYITYLFEFALLLPHLKKVALILLLATLVLPFVFKTGILVHYGIKQKHYAEVLCENKTKPELKCNGKCQLMKELALQNDEPQAPTLPSNVVQYELSGFLLPEKTSFCFNHQSDNSQKIRQPSTSYYFDWIDYLFQPPEKTAA